MNGRRMRALWRFAPGALVLSGLLVAAQGPAAACEKMKAATMVQAESVWEGAKAEWIVVGEQYVDVASGAEGMRAAIDPATGELRAPSQAESRELNRLAAQSAKQSGKKRKKIRVVRFSNGMALSTSAPDELDYAVVSIGPEGEITMDCVEGLDKAAAAVQSGLPVSAPAPVLEEK